MRRGIPAVMILVLVLTLVLCVGLYAQIKKDEKTGLDRINGIIHLFDKAKSTMMVEQSGAAQKAMYKIVYDNKTDITIEGKAAKTDDLKEGLTVTVLGKYEKNVLNASRIEIRTAK